MIATMGWKRTFTELVPRYPGLILMPAFTGFTFGPIDTQANGLPFCCGSVYTITLVLSCQGVLSCGVKLDNSGWIIAGYYPPIICLAS